MHQSTCTPRSHRPRVLSKGERERGFGVEIANGHGFWSWPAAGGTDGRIIKLCRAHTAHAYTHGAIIQ